MRTILRTAANPDRDEPGRRDPYLEVEEAFA